MTKSMFSSFSGGIVPVVKGSKMWATSLVVQYRSTRNVNRKAIIAGELARYGFYLPEGGTPPKKDADVFCSDGYWHTGGCGKYKVRTPK